MHPVTAAESGIEQLYRFLGPDDADSAVSVILKMRGETCDLDCLYCYEKRKESPGGARVDASQVHALGTLFSGRPLAVELHGGEPLTAGHDQMAEVLGALAAEPSVVRVSLQTNGVLLDDAWLDLFERLCPDLRIGISLDGDERGNAWRVGYDGRPVYPRVAESLGLLARRGKRAGVICAVTPAVLGRAEAVLDHLAAFDAVDAVSFVPCFDTSVVRPTAVSARREPASRVLQRAHVNGAAGADWAIRPAEYTEFVLRATVRWITKGHFTRLKLEPAVSVIRRQRGLDTGFCHFTNLKCDHVFTLYPDGRLGSCDELPWPQARLGMLDDMAEQSDVVRAQRNSRLLNQGKSLMGRCVSCDYRDTCGGGCVATRWRYDRAGEEDEYCDSRMRLVDGVAALAAHPGRPAGAWCRSARWHQPSPNSMHDVAAFMARWNRPAVPRPAARLRTSPYGNINTVGLPGVHEADDLDPAHPDWYAALEPGVRPLVDVLTAGWGLITYDSCEGHDYTGTDLPMAERMAGILPRDPDEYAAVASALCRTVTRAAPALPAEVRAAVDRCYLTCETTGRMWPVLNLRLRPSPGYGRQAYRDVLSRATDVLTEAARHDGPDPGTACGCTRSGGTAPARDARAHTL